MDFIDETGISIGVYMLLIMILIGATNLRLSRIQKDINEIKKVFMENSKDTSERE